MNSSMYEILLKPIQQLPGIGPSIAKKLTARGINCLGDLLLHLPRSYEEDQRITPIAELQAEQLQRIQCRIVSKHAHGFGRNRQVSMLVADETASLHLRFFHSGYMMSDARLSEGREVSVRGKATIWRGQWQMAHPEWCVPEQFQPGIFPRYGMLAGYSGKRIGGWIQHIVPLLGADQSSPLDAVAMQFDVTGSLSMHQAWQAIHLENHDAAPVEEVHQAVQRLKLEELLIYFELMSRQRRQARVNAQAFERFGLCEQFLDSLPYALTPAQQQAWHDIRQDLMQGERMHRLVQGDVGSGKTWVAVLSMLAVVDSGAQAALMAPTEVLAVQHFQTIQDVLDSLRISSALLTGSTTKVQRKEILKGLESGDIAVVIGTHALLTEDVVFHQLGLAIIDEQHRFGVEQRWALTKKSEAVHLLAMSATPIPRSLALALFGDLDLTLMQGMPPGRKPVETRIYAAKDKEKLYQGMQRILDQGGQIYWIVPRIAQEDEECGEMTVEERRKILAGRFPGTPVAALHGQMKSRDKNAVLDGFSSGQSRLMVSTTVVEVGVNVPAARLIVIEDAELYGLAQLHQLRGRVGRSDQQSYCMLLPGQKVGEQGVKRLSSMTECHDGMQLAELDLQTRGAGDAIGLRQSGDSGFRLVDLSADSRLIEQVHQKMGELSITQQVSDTMVQFWRPESESVD